MTTTAATPSAAADPLLRARYGRSDAAPLAALNPVLDNLLGHRSVRAFLPDALPAHALETLVAAAQSAPSSSNLQTWSVVAVESPEARARLVELTGNQKHIAQAPLFLAWLADLSRIQRIAERAGREVAGTAYLEAFLLGAIDAALAAQNVVAAAPSLGLGTVFAGALRNRPEEVIELLGTPRGAFPVFGLVVGVPDPARPADVKPRLPQSAVLHRERYRVPATNAEEVGDYDAVLRAFQAEQGLPQQDWTTLVVNRLQDAKALHGRDRLAEALRHAGFPLK
ncbi:NADPH-dependent oxidoreductase [Xylophilus sp.]|uniref:NADPH-dependent oxidoreductase n=1 Tax=Xylophilus sp. TaxID=2653893 RepID=UPI0013B9F084|nr:NADPH-dependent oxidoreductase [Xylophilus sp.]KAF1044799.1 MAG: FMN reductase (NADPH) [Xylophilus sp.]